MEEKVTQFADKFEMEGERDGGNLSFLTNISPGPTTQFAGDSAKWKCGTPYPTSLRNFQTEITEVGGPAECGAPWIAQVAGR